MHAKVTREQFEEAYPLWSGATEVYKVMMADAMAGKPIDIDSMHQQIAELERLHEDWVAKSQPFVHWLP